VLNGKTIFITGGTGSFGQYFIKTIIKKYKPEKIIIFSRDEMKQYVMQNDQFFSKYIGGDKDLLRFFIGDIRDLERLKMAMRGVDYVVHAAALKQVPATEYNPFEAVKTNILGGQNVIDASFENNVEKVIALSTDKAAAPINLYGATKLTSDKLFITANNYRGNQNIKFSVVRYGNVMGSRGSVIPFFKERKESGVLPITDNRMTRFNITLEEGVTFVLKNFERMIGGELFVPKIPSYNIVDIANAIAPECAHEFVGIRPGEKLHEDMITESDAMNTLEFEDYYMIVPSAEHWKKIYPQHSLIKSCKEGFIYNSFSNDHFLTVEELKILIQDL
jgi:UDP-N-acetylglucosamine 4,6-dehydratase/5-epimerase